MFKVNIYLTFLLLFFCQAIFAQQQFTISGYVKDKTTGEYLFGAGVYEEKSNRGVSANDSGFYSLALPKDSIILVFTNYGYLDHKQKIYLDKDIHLDIELETEISNLEEVVIEQELQKEEELETAQMSVIKLTTQDAKMIPAFMGEVDLLKALQLKPGVQSGGEGSSGLYVRGGGPDQNLILLDEAPVYNATHLFGFFSVFNPDAIKDVELYKGGFPAQYGGRLSSVVDLKMLEGNKNKLSVNGGVGVIASRLTIEGPIKKDKSTFIVSARRTYFDVFTRQYNKANKGKEDFNPIPDYYFHDVNGKVSFRLGKNDRLYLSAYYGRDIFGFKQGNFDFKFKWGNTISTLRWNHDFNSRLTSNFSLIFSDYNYEITNTFHEFSFSLGSQITDINLKTDFTYYPNDKHIVKFGSQSIYHQFTVGRLKAGSEDEKVSFNAGNYLNATDVAIYISDDYTLNPRWKFNSGLRVSSFINDGKFYGGFEPRFSARYKINEKISAKASIARMYQYIHLVSNSGASLPTDVWYPSTRIVKPQRSDQAATGITFSLWDSKFLLTNEIYYKWMKRQIDFKDGAQLFANDNLENEFLLGKGWSYGNEIYLEKKKGKLTGWIGYTLSWTWRQFDDINKGNKFPARYDRRHDISVVLMYAISKKVSLSATWVYGTGNAISLPVGRFYLQEPDFARARVVPEFLERNSFRMPSYHRLDLGLIWKFLPKWGNADLTFSVYNVYNRRNPYFIYYEDVVDANRQTVKFRAKQVALFPIIASVTFNFKF